MLRQFRDEFIANLPDGPDLIHQYYAIAPGIITRINTTSRRVKILAGILADVRDAVGLIEAGQNNAALIFYRSMTQRVSAAVEAYPRFSFPHQTPAVQFKADFGFETFGENKHTHHAVSASGNFSNFSKNASG